MIQRFATMSLMLMGLLLILGLPLGFQQATAEAQTLEPDSAPPPALPVQLTLEDHFSGTAYDVVVTGTYAFAGMNQGLEVLDISDPTQPVRVTTLEILVTDLDIEGEYLYGWNGDGAFGDLVDKFYVFDISTPSAPRQITTVETQSSGIEVAGNRAYLSAGQEVLIFDLSSPAQPSLIGTYRSQASELGRVKVAGNYAYVVTNGESRERGLEIVNVEDATKPKLVGKYVWRYWVGTDLDVAGNFVYISTTARHDFSYPLLVIDVSDPAAPTLVDDSLTFWLARNIVVAGEYAYIAGPSLSIIDISDPTAPEERGGLQSTSYFPSGLAVSEGFVYVADRQGVDIVDARIPETATRAGGYPGVYAGDIVKAGSYAYLTGSPALQVMDTTNPTSATIVATALPDRSGSQLAVQGHYAYIAGGEAGGLRVVDILTPTMPIEVGHNEVITANYVTISGSYAYVGAGQGGFSVVDVSDPTTPTEVANLAAPNVPNESFTFEVAVAGEIAYVAEGISGLRVIDISTPTAPQEIARFHPMRRDGAPARIEGVVVVGNIAYLNSERNTMFVVDVSDPGVPTQQGYYETGWGLFDIAVEDKRAYLLTSRGIEVVDVASSRDLRHVGRYEFIGAGEIGPQLGIDVADGHVYVAAGAGGFLLLRSTVLSERVWLPVAQR